LALHWPSAVQSEHTLERQMGLAAGHCMLLVAVQSTQLPVVVLHVSVPEQASASRVLHSSQVPSAWQAGVLALRAAQAVSPAALLEQASQVFVLVSQMGADPGQSLLARQRTQVLVAVLQILSVASSAQWVLSVHSTHVPLLSLHVVLV
jgi:hypothetical protein